jgi:oligopeptide/dipeptide ABC transporter ATP-binding protein
MYAGRIVESATADVVLGRPAHPYTAGLLSSTPDLDGDHRRLVPIKGAPLSLLEEPAGCSFTARCPYAVEGRCDAEVPHLRASAGGHAVRCVRSTEIAAQLAELATRGGAR